MIKQRRLEKRRVYVQFYVSPELKANLKKLSELENKSMSMIVTEVVNRHVMRKLRKVRKTKKLELRQERKIKSS